ncbi:haloacid dehalogenase-like hydrolase [Clostridium simiarum]|nr:haloacid dehalogenase-like hydrolase [Clostridium simiarum]
MSNIKKEAEVTWVNFNMHNLTKEFKCSFETSDEDINQSNYDNQYNKDEVILNRGNFAYENYESLKSLIENKGNKSKDYDENKKPYAVFDWDNTSIINDTEDSVLAYQLMNLKFKMDPKEFSRVIRIGVPKDNFNEKFNNKEGNPVNIELIGADIDSDYKFLYDNYEGLNGDKSLDYIKQTLQYKDFIAKTRYLYDAISDSFDLDVSYPWVIYLFSGMTVDEVSKLSEESIIYWLKHEINRTTWTSPLGLEGKSGIVSVTFNSGIKPIKEMQNLYKTLMYNGIDVYICSASYLYVVREFASNPKFGYIIPKENVFGMQLEIDKGGLIKPELKINYDQTQGEGKTKTIKRFLVKKHGGKSPLIVSGDNHGDVSMLSSFHDTSFSLIINRCVDKELFELSKKAAHSIGNKDARYHLQGRNENTGKFIPSQKSILFGTNEERLLR